MEIINANVQEKSLWSLRASFALQKPPNQYKSSAESSPPKY